MRAIRADLPTTLEMVELLVLADYHYADPHSDHDAIKRDITYVAEHENAYCVLAGDLMNCAIKSSVSDTYGDTLSPMDELSVCQDLLAPIAHKIVGIVGGNHEARHYKTNGVDMTRILARQIGVEDKYSPDTALVFLRFGRDNQRNGHHRPILYTIYLTHGTGGGRKEGGKIQRLIDLSNIVDADVYVCGHTHAPASMKTAFARPNPGNSAITYCTKLFVNSAAKLDYGGYGDIGGFRPNSKDTPRVLLSGTQKDMRAVV